MLQDKKAEKEQQRDQAIKQADVDNLLGPRHQESLKLKELLGAKKLSLFQVDNNIMLEISGNNASSHEQSFSISFFSFIDSF